MDKVEHDRHLVAGRIYGREASCGKKQDYKSESTAVESAERMTVKFGRDLEAYPCFWCKGWHIGRKMTAKEWEWISGYL